VNTTNSRAKADNWQTTLMC